MSSSVQRSLAAPRTPTPMISNRHRVERGAVATLGVASIYQGGKGLIGDFQEWRETKIRVTTTLNKPLASYAATPKTEEEAQKLTADDGDLVTYNHTTYQIDKKNPQFLTEGTNISYLQDKPTGSKKQTYWRMASVALHTTQIFFGFAALNASRK